MRQQRDGWLPPSSTTSTPYDRAPMMGGYLPQQPEQQGRSNPLRWWHRYTALPQAPAGASFAERERARRSQLASTIILGFLLVELLVLPVGLSDPATLYGILGGVVACSLALLLNRFGRVTTAGLLVAVVTDTALLGAILGAPGGQLDLIYVPLYDLLVLTELVAVSILPPASVFLVAFGNSSLILLDVHFQPATAAFSKLLGTPDGYTAVIRPIVLQLVVALVAYLWVRSSTEAIRRADRAEEVAELERRDAERRRELEEGVHELLSVHVQLANGNFNVRTRQLRNPLLWQIGSSLNNLIARFARQGQADFVLQRTHDEATRLVDALRMLQSGRQPLWPAATGTPVDQITQFLQRWVTQEQVASARPPAALPPGWQPAGAAGTAGSSPSAPPSYPSLPRQGASDSPLPEWLRSQYMPQPQQEAPDVPRWPGSQQSGVPDDADWPDLGADPRTSG
jgi:hypothetical protein